jgi:hypothetical protein
MGRCSRRLIVLLGLTVGLPAVGATQSAAEARVELDRLLPEWRAANEAVIRAEHARRVSAAAMPIERGHLRLTVDSAIARQVSEAAAIASTSLDRTFGADARRVADYPMIALLQRVARKGDTTRMIHIRRPVGAKLFLTNGRRLNNETRTVTIGRRGETDTALVRALEAVAAVPLHGTLDENLRLWFRTPLPASAETGEEIETVYVLMMTASTAISRGCLAGELRRCRELLGLSPVGDPVLDGHTAAQRRTTVEVSAERLRTPGNAAEFDDCVVNHDDAACIARLRDLSAEELGSGFSSTAARRSFARWAIALGGPDAYSRLRASHALPLDDRFAATAGVSSDSLVASWRSHVVAARPTTPNTPPVTAMTTLLWIAACGALSLRSSRWR